ncbi:bardet-Biedl syndrome 5 protein [Histomonas meleagridis]|uniref:bardet-Biedl syndrome 5 protein n=1 Tax=Histomonas meleagridis TaxID=135588 RepID=UPI003559B4F5|nr:bardet-Biedl syndrome 5 protein [Histomonas meleagridis]KAH0800490.1 bardet-Biedl syndrome 5 protein [Histomonas meleagridis]
MSLLSIGFKFMQISPSDDEFEIPKDCQISMYQADEELTKVPGEYIYTLIVRVEDLKAHPGQYGQLQITNIRLIWRIPHTVNNISIGYKTISNYSIKETVASGDGVTESLTLHCMVGHKVYEFIFCVSKSTPSNFRFFETAYQNYINSTLLREQRLRSSIIKDGKLILLINEQVILRLDGISNFAGLQAKSGTAIVTNLRFIWYSEIVSNFNVSIPLILLPELSTHRSKRFGRALYLKLRSNGDRFMYGFTYQPEEGLVKFTNTFEKVRLAAMRHPMLTPLLKLEEKVVNTENVNANDVEEDTNVLEVDNALMYVPIDLIDDNAEKGKIVFDKTIGLAIEELPKGCTLESRWVEASNTPLVGIDEL